MMSRTRRFLLFSALALTVAVSQPVTSVGSSDGGLTISSGGIDVTGDIVDGDGNTVWDDSNNHVPEQSMQTGNLVWGDLGISQSDVSASDIGLGNVEDEAQFAEDGSDTLGSNLDLGGDGIDNVRNNINNGQGNYLKLDDGSDVYLQAEEDSTSNAFLSLNGRFTVYTDRESGFHECTMSESDGSWSCDGTKDWIHDLNSTHDAVYSSQESPQVRAVYEGNTTVTDGRVNVSLPAHFEGTVSDEKPILRVQATPRSLATVAVTDRSDSWIVIEASKDVKVDYRVTGIRDGYEDKEVVRQKSN